MHDCFVAIKSIIQKPRNANDGRRADFGFLGNFAVWHFFHQHLCNAPTINQPFKLGWRAKIIKEIARLNWAVQRKNGVEKIIFMHCVYLVTFQRPFTLFAVPLQRDSGLIR